jgi:hypothetical protein
MFAPPKKMSNMSMMYAGVLEEEIGFESLAKRDPKDEAAAVEDGPGVNFMFRHFSRKVFGQSFLYYLDKDARF